MSSPKVLPKEEVQSYKGFGSFHSDNVQDLIQLPKSEYSAPIVPEFARTLDSSTSIVPSSSPKQEEDNPSEFDFGLSARKHFRMSREWTFINHGAFGGALSGGIKIKRGYEDLLEDQPLTFVDRTLLPLLVHSARSVADFINATPADVALVPNATFGLNAAIFGIIESTDVVCYMDTEYGSVWRMLLERCERVGAKLHEIPMGRYLHNDSLFGDDVALTAYVKQALPPGCTTILLDHIASNGAFELPIFTHLIPMLRKETGVRNIIIDGAHGPLQCSLNFGNLPKESRPSVYVANLHKWFSCPKSVGFIWTHEAKMKNKIRSPVVSHGFNSGYFSEFVWNGTTDYGAHLTVPAIADFWMNKVGVEKTRDYCKKLLLDATQMLEVKFGVKAMPRKAPFMALVQLPSYLNAKKFSSKYIQDTLHYKYNVEVPVKNIEGRLYYRLSCFVYNTLADYERLAVATEELCKEQQQRGKRNRSDEDDDGAANENGGVNEDEDEDSDANAGGGCGTENSGCGVGGLGGSQRRQIQFEGSDSDDDE